MKEFHKTIKTLIELNRKHRMYYPTDRNILPFSHYAKEYATVRCDIGRITGKTEFIKLNARFHDLILVGKERYKRGYRGTSAEVMTIDELIRNREGRRYNFNIIYIDEPMMVFVNKSFYEYEMYEILANSYEHTFIFLGI